MIHTRYQFQTNVATLFNNNCFTAFSSHVFHIFFLQKFHQKVNLARHERSHLPRGVVKCQYCGAHCVSTEDLKAHLLSHTLLQPDLSQADIKVEKEASEKGKEEALLNNLDTIDRMEETSDERPKQDLQSELLPNSGNEPDLKLLSRTKGELPSKEPLLETANMLKSGHNSEGIKVFVKSSLESGLNAEVKDRELLPSRLRTKVVPVITSNLNLHPNSLPNPETHVFIPQSISSISLSTDQQPLHSEYVVQKHPTISPPSSSKTQSSSSVFCVRNNSLNSNVCALPSRTLLGTTHLETVNASTHTYHISTSGNNQVAVEGQQTTGFPHSNAEHVNDAVSREEGLTFTPNSTLGEDGCIYEPNPSVTTVAVPTLDSHVLASEQMVDSVVLIAQPSLPDS